MGESVSAVTLPGRTRVSTGAPDWAGATETVGAARELVRAARTSLAWKRRRTPIAASTKRTSRTMPTPNNARRGEMGADSGAVSWWDAASCDFGLGSAVINIYSGL